MSLVWTVQWDPKAKKQLAKLGVPAQRAIVRYLETRIAPALDPRLYGKGLVGPLKGIWRYRVGDYRILCQIKDEIVTILIIDVDHRKNIYD